MKWFYMISLSLCTLFSAGVEAQACGTLSGTSVKDGKILSAEREEGFCNVTARIWPADLSSKKNSFIDVFVMLPAKSNWNRRMLGLGNGGYSPRIPEERMKQKVAEGYAVAATDTGHKKETLDFISDANERIDYWGRTSVHVLSQTAETVISQYYAMPPEFSYFQGCSTGGHQAMSAAQFYPDDYDGIIAGAPGNNRVALNAAFLWLFQQTHKKDGTLLFEKSDLSLLSEHVLAQCDSLDGKSDGLISDISACKPNLEGLRCTEHSVKQCFNSDQISRIKNIYQGPVDAVTGESLYPGFPPGSEFTGGVGWSAYWADPQKPDKPARLDFWTLWALPDRGYKSLWEFDWHEDFNAAKARLSPRIDATQSDLSAFTGSGRKLLIFHGLADPVVSAADTIRFYQSVKKSSANADNTRLFLVPGMSHCRGGKYVKDADWLSPLIEWVENNRPPDSVTGKVEQRSVLLTPYE